jgi:hypothetical protein
VVNDKLFGFIECDLETPDDLKEKFGEFPPIFKNTKIDDKKIGTYMRKLRKTLKKEGTTKLIQSYFGEKIMIYTPLLKWYLKHGLVVTKVHSVIYAKKNKPFNDFAESVSNARRKGDDAKYSMIAEMMKLVGNSAFGRSCMNKNKQTKTLYEDDILKAKKRVNSHLFRDMVQFGEGDNKVYEIQTCKKQVRQNTAMQVGCAVFQLAKLRMLQFYYDCLDKFISRDNFELVQMDTDSMYMGLSFETFNESIKPEMKEQFEAERHLWFPREDHLKFDRRTPGLVKIEWEGRAMIALTSKMYYGLGKVGKKNKASHKGLQKTNNLDLINFNNYKKCLYNKSIMKAKNKGFRMFNNSMTTYTQIKDGLSPIYDKRIVLKCGVKTRPIMI